MARIARVYSVKFENKIKIGVTTNIRDRLYQLRFYNKEKEIEVFLSQETKFAYKSEKIILNLLKKHNIYGEYFKYDFEKSKKIIKKIIKNQILLNSNKEFNNENLSTDSNGSYIFLKNELIDIFGEVWIKYAINKKIVKTRIHNRYLLTSDLSEKELFLLEKWKVK